jgi:hypothetical protein
MSRIELYVRCPGNSDEQNDAGSEAFPSTRFQLSDTALRQSMRTGAVATGPFKDASPPFPKGCAQTEERFMLDASRSCNIQKGKNCVILNIVHCLEFPGIQLSGNWI